MLFDTPKEKRSVSGNSLVCMDHPAGFISSQDDYLSKYLREIDWKISGKTYHFTSNGRFALHDMLIHIAGKMDGANCMVTSFNLSIIAAKSFIRAWDKGFFKSLRFVLNAQKKSNFKEAVKFIDGKFTIVYTSIHAKVGLLWDKEKYVTIVTTGNLSNNNNIERGLISTARDIFEYDKKWIDGLFETGNSE